MQNLQERIHLDHINGAPLLPEVQEALRQAVTRLANPSSLHAEGRAAAALREKARAQVAALIGAHSEEITFTSSGTEANAWALEGLAEARFPLILRQASPEQGRRAQDERGTSSARTVEGSAQAGRGRHLVVSAVEHLSVLQAARRMEKQGWRVTLVPVDGRGRVEPAAVEQALTPETALVSVQWANGEVGTLQPVAEIARRMKERGVLFHADAVAAVGQVPVDVRAVPVDALSLAGNLFGGPPGVGALYLRKGTRIQPLFVGGAQEEGLRAGTENLLGIVGMGAAAEAAARNLPVSRQLVPLRERLIRGILEVLPDARLNGHPTERLPGHASISFLKVDAEELVYTLDRLGAAVGLGSACTSQIRKASHVLRAMGVEERAALGTITCTLGPQSSAEEVEGFVRILRGVLQRHSEASLSLPKAGRRI